MIPAGPAGRLSVAAVCRAGPTCCCSPELTTSQPCCCCGEARWGLWQFSWLSVRAECGGHCGLWSHTSRERERERECRDQQVGANPLSGLILDSKLITGGIILTGGGVRFHRLWRPQPIVRSCTDHVTRSDQWQARSWGVVSFMSSERRTQSARIKYCELTSSPRS